jgi:hypothetical protein
MMPNDIVVVYLFSPTVINEDWRDDEGPHPSALRAATFPRGEGFWIASAGILPSPLGKVAGAKRRSDEVPRHLAKSPFAAGLNSYVVVSVSFKLCRQSCGDNANIGIFRGAIVALAVDDSEHIMNDTYREKTQFIIAMVDIEIFKAQLIVEYMQRDIEGNTMLSDILRVLILIPHSNCSVLRQTETW